MNLTADNTSFSLCKTFCTPSPCPRPSLLTERTPRNAYLGHLHGGQRRNQQGCYWPLPLDLLLTRRTAGCRRLTPTDGSRLGLRTAFRRRLKKEPKAILRSWLM